MTQARAQAGLPPAPWTAKRPWRLVAADGSTSALGQEDARAVHAGAKGLETIAAITDSAGKAGVPKSSGRKETPRRSIEGPPTLPLQKGLGHPVVERRNIGMPRATPTLGEMLIGPCCRSSAAPAIERREAVRPAHNSGDVAAAAMRKPVEKTPAGTAPTPPPPRRLDPQLAKVITAWDSLPRKLQATIVALIESATAGREGA
ncbi:MAG: hypothetical protein ACOY3P_23475 [Planctomycetota bacterium]